MFIRVSVRNSHSTITYLMHFRKAFGEHKWHGFRPDYTTTFDCEDTELAEIQH